MSTSTVPERTATRTVLVVDDDRDVAELTEALLTDDGYTVSCLFATEADLVLEAVGRLEPDCVLLDSTGPTRRFGTSWDLAEHLARRERPVPVVMFTADSAAVQEAQAQQSRRSQVAALAGIVPKPFDLEQLLAVVAAASGASAPFNHSPAADATRTQALVERLQQGGATDIAASPAREWVTFRGPSGHVLQLYWWQRRGVYYVGRYAPDGEVLKPIGRFADREAAVLCALGA